MSELNLNGIGVVNATPMRADGSVNYDVYAQHVRWLADSGVSYVVPAAATGEIIALREEERRALVEKAVTALDGSARVVAYSGRANTVETIEALRAARDAGAHAAYIVQPWFCKPDQDGIYRHFSEVAEAVSDLPLIIYNNPDRTSCDITHATMAKILDTLPVYQAIKDADHNSLVETFATFAHRVPVFPRSEREMIWAFASGAPGVLTFSGNYLAKELVEIHRMWSDGETGKALETYRRYYPLMNAVFKQPIPAAVKFSLSELGFDFGEPRLPILPVYDQVAASIRDNLAALGVAR